MFTEAEESLTEYKEELMKVQISYGNYINGISYAKVQKEYLEGIDGDLDDIRYDLNHMIRNEREKRGSLNCSDGTAALTDYEGNQGAIGRGHCIDDWRNCRQRLRLVLHKALIGNKKKNNL